MKLNGKVALVTGSSGGIGQGIAIRLAEEGAKVVVNYRSNPQGAEQTLDAIKKSVVIVKCSMDFAITIAVMRSVQTWAWLMM
jgi:NAD(P)-dependent dehydrogenase (short-subunit alcohol dehydrogenase family)